MPSRSLSRRVLGAVAGASLLVGLIPTVASAATPEKRDITEFACPPSEVPDPGFSDDDNTTAEHRASIACIVWYELASGKTPTTYAPNEAVNRGQMATFIGNLLVAGGVSLPDSPPDAFSDDNGTQHEKRINQLAALGVVEGDDNGRYNARFPVTRAQMASFLNRAYEEITGAALTASEDYFTDDEGAFHEDNINAVAAAGIAAGKTASTYAPAESVKRDQMATFLARETDLLVEKGKITKPDTKPAEVKLTTTSVPQGGTVKGSIDTQEGVKVTGAKVTGCGLTNHTLTLTGEANAFEFTIPVTQPAGTCKLTFTVDREEGDSITEEETITVTAGTSQTAAPELLKVEKISESGDDVVLRYTFDEALKSLTLDHEHFRVYDANADRDFAKATPAPRVSGSTVEATFSKDAFADATTATVVANAVEDQQSVGNPEGAAPLAQQTTTVTGTDAPDLVQVSNQPAGGTTWVFLFDEKIELHPGTAENYHLVLLDGTVENGDEITASDTTDDEQVSVTFNGVDKANVARGYVDTDTVAGHAGDRNPLNGVEEGNPTQAKDVLGGGETPYLVSVDFDATNNKVIYTFNRSVTVTPTNELSPARFIAYDLEGNEVGTNDATANGSTVTATFSGSPDPITGSTVGASVRPDAVRATSGTRQPNQVDEERLTSTRTVSGARGGETAAPDLRSVTRSIEGNDTVLTYTFDQAVTRSSNPTSPTDGDFVIYQQDGTRTELDLNDSTGNECTVDGSTVECRAVSTSTLGQQLESAVLGGVEYNAVAGTSSGAPRNYEAAAPIS